MVRPEQVSRWGTDGHLMDVSGVRDTASVPDSMWNNPSCLGWGSAPPGTPRRLGSPVLVPSSGRQLSNSDQHVGPGDL